MLIKHLNKTSSPLVRLLSLQPPRACSLSAIGRCAAVMASPEDRPHKRRKLEGRAFYESIGSPKLILAPMVDQSEFAWRLLTRSYMPPEQKGSLLAYSPMLHSRLFSQQVKMREKYFQPTKAGLPSPPAADASPPTADVYLDGRPDLDRPLTVQFCANDPDELLAAAKYVQPFCDAVDLNLGCPQGIARKGHYGAFLQEDPDLIYRLINKLHRELDVPVTAKIRILETKEQTLRYAQTVLAAGASILTVHGRRRDQKGQNTGLADWSAIRYLRDNLPPATVLFANGNILRHADLARCLAATGADGVMAAEANLHDPTLFAGPPADPADRAYWRGRDGRGGYRVDAVFRRYLAIVYKYVLEAPEPARAPLFHPADPAVLAPDVGPELDGAGAAGPPPAKRPRRGRDAPAPSINLCAMQSHLFSLMRSLIVVHTDVRDALARTRIGDMESFETVLRMTETVVREGLLDYEAHPEKYEQDPGAKASGAGPDEQNGEAYHAARDGASISSVPEDTGAQARIADYERTVKECWRPWWVCQPYLRPLPEVAVAKGALTVGKKQRRHIESLMAAGQEE